MTSANSVCRVCLSGNLRMLHIKHVHIIKLFEKLTNSKLNTESDAGMPNTVCYVCHRHLQRFHLFSDMACRSDKTMRDLLHYNIEITCSTITMLSLATVPTLSVASTQHVSVIDYSNTTSTPASVKEEQLSFKTEGTAETEETVFEEIEMTSGEGTVDGSNELCAENVDEVENESTNIYLYFHCNVCNKKMSSKKKLVEHIKTHTNKTFTYKRNLSTHMNIDTGEKPYSCIKYSKAFTQKDSLVKHIMHSHTGEKPYSCIRCDKAFTRKADLVFHMHSHTGERPYSCIRCDKAFTRKVNFVIHMRSHTGERPYSCIRCDKAFSHKSNLSRHMQLHSDLKPHSCSRCDKTFNEKKSLTNHMRLHTGEKPHSCIRCDKAFTRKYDLVEHMRSHTGEKPYSCIRCSEAFTKTYDLAKHMLLHTGEKPYTCITCKKAFIYKSALAEHMLSHTGERPCKN